MTEDEKWEQPVIIIKITPSDASMHIEDVTDDDWAHDPDKVAEFLRRNQQEIEYEVWDAIGDILKANVEYEVENV